MYIFTIYKAFYMTNARGMSYELNVDDRLSPVTYGTKLFSIINFITTV